MGLMVERQTDVSMAGKRLADVASSNTNGINYRPVCAQSLNPMDMIVSG
jgi:hypothetical protein